MRRSRLQSPASLAARYENHAGIQRTLVRDLQRVQKMLDTVDGAFRLLLSDEHFVTLLRAEGLDRIPAALIKKDARVEMPRHVQIGSEGVAPEAWSLLESRGVSPTALHILARMTPLRQAEAARLMVAVGCYSAPYAKALMGGTYRSSVNGPRSCAKIPMGRRKRKAANQEITEIADQLNLLDGLSGADLLTLLVSCRYADRLLANARVKRYLENKWPAVCGDLSELVRVPFTNFRSELCDCSRLSR